MILGSVWQFVVPVKAKQKQLFDCLNMILYDDI